MIIGILKEPTDETRVSFLPDIAEIFIKRNIQLMAEQDAGANAFADDTAYQARGVIMAARNEVLSQANIILTIHPLS